MLRATPAPRNTPPARSAPVMVSGALQDLGVRLTLARKLRGLTQEQLGHLSDVSTSTVRALEAGAEGVAIANFLKVLQALGLLGQVGQLLDPRHDPETLAYAERQLRAP